MTGRHGRILHHAEPSVYPYFPLKLSSQANQWHLLNPLDGCEYILNNTSYWLLHYCNGMRHWDAILSVMAQHYGLTKPFLRSHVEPFVRKLTEAGILWWRRQPVTRQPCQPPKGVLWEVTSKCNLLCQHCVVEAGKSKKGELTLNRCLALVDELAEYGVQHIILSGGEPLIRRDLFDIAASARKRGIVVHIATNGTMITKEIAVHLRDIGVYAQVSLDGATPSVHDGFRGRKGAWKSTIQGITDLVEAGVPVLIASTITRNNVTEIPELLRLAKRLGAHTFRILPFVPYGRGRKKYKLEVQPEEMKAITAYLRSERDKGEIQIAPMEFECTFAALPPPLYDPHMRIGCGGASAYCTITSNGDVLPCNFFAGVKAENLNEHSFRWIWKYSEFLNYFRSLNISDLGGACQGCSWLPACRGSCIATNFVHGSIFQGNRHCWIEKQASRSVALTGGT